MTARIIPIRRTQRQPCAELACSLHADAAADAIMDAPDLAAGYRAEIIRAAADGDPERVRIALREAAQKMKAIPMSIEGPDWHPDMKAARTAMQLAEMMREMCVSSALALIEKEPRHD